jgi:hypothetical protein
MRWDTDPVTGQKRKIAVTQLPEYGTPERRALINGDTPFGVYLSGKGEPGNETVLERSGEREYGPWKVCFEPILREPGAEANKRDLIREHGGGSDLPDPFAKYQMLTPTKGCMRFYNIDMDDRVEAIQRAQAMDGHKHGVFVVGDDAFLAWLAFDPELPKRWRKYKVYDKTGLHYVDLMRFLTLNYGSSWLEPDLDVMDLPWLDSRTRPLEAP